MRDEDEILDRLEAALYLLKANRMAKRNGCKSCQRDTINSCLVHVKNLWRLVFEETKKLFPEAADATLCSCCVFTEELHDKARTSEGIQGT